VARYAALDDPEVLLELRRSLIDCLTRASHALDRIENSIQQTETWLRDDRAPAVKRQLLQTETRFGESRIAYAEAKSRLGNDMARSHETEERDFLRARAAFQQTEELMRRIQGWMIRLPREASEPMGLIRRARHTLEQVGPQAVARLDSMIASIERYQAASRPSGASAGGVQGDAGQGGADAAQEES
jgi:hypothetical protein